MTRSDLSIEREVRTPITSTVLQQLATLADTDRPLQAYKVQQRHPRLPRQLSAPNFVVVFRAHGKTYCEVADSLQALDELLLLNYLTNPAFGWIPLPELIA